MGQTAQVNSNTSLDVGSTSKRSMASALDRKGTLEELCDQEGDGDIDGDLWGNATGGQSLELLQGPISALLLGVGLAPGSTNDVLPYSTQEGALYLEPMNISEIKKNINEAEWYSQLQDRKPVVQATGP